MKLTDVQIKRAKGGVTGGAKGYKLADGAGLYLLVTPAGGKLWRWDYRMKGKPRTMALGKYPEVSLVRARAVHGDGRKLRASGVDPMEQRKSEKALTHTGSFASVARLWWEHRAA